MGWRTTALKARLRPKKAARRRYSKIVCARGEERWRRLERVRARVLVEEVVVSFAKRELVAAKMPERMERWIHRGIGAAVMVRARWWGGGVVRRMEVARDRAEVGA